MRVVHYSVTQIRVAATCPRLHWFDARASRETGKTYVSRIWKQGGSSTACGALFHRSIEKFTRIGAADPAVAELVRTAEGETALHQALMRYINTRCIDLDALRKYDVSMRRAFIDAVHRYVDELATFVNASLSIGVASAEIVDNLFGDPRKRVDVTFHLPQGTPPVHVSGAIDYVYWNYARQRHRLMDYKLTPAVHASNDLFQVAVYALMHDHQHGTKPDVALYYLHPNREIREKSWEDIHAERGKVYDLLASMVAWAEYDADTRSGLLPPGDLAVCGSCKHDKSGACLRVLGPKVEGARLRIWKDATASGEEPTVEVREPAVVPPVEEIDPLEQAEPLAQVRPVEKRVLAEKGEQAETNEPAEKREPVEKRVPAGKGELAETNEPAEKGEPAEKSELAEKGEPAEKRAPVEKSERAENSEPVGPAESAEARTARQAPAPEDEPGQATGEAALFLGQTSETKVSVRIPVRHLHTHVAVVGAAGSGKTWTAKAVAEEAILQGVPVIAIDPQGDLVQFLHRANADDIPTQWRSAYEAFHDTVETRVFTPGTSHARRLSIQPLRALSADALKRVETEERRREEYAAMLTSVAHNVVALSGIGGGASAAACNFVYRVLECLFRSHPEGVSFGLVSRACLDPEDFGIDDAERLIAKAARVRLGQALYGLTVGSSASLFSGGEALDIPTLLQPGAAGKVPLNVIYLNALSTDAEKQFFVAALAAEIYRWMVCELEATGKTNLLLYLDEAKDYIPAGTSQPPAKQPLVRLFSQGRKYGVSCLVCTQSPRSVDYNVFSNASTKLIGRLESAQDVDRVVEWFSVEGSAPKWIAGRKAAIRGSFVARWPELPAALDGRAFTCRPLFSLHEGAWSPERVERECRIRP